MNSGISRYSVEKGPHAKHGDAPHRNSSPVNNMQHDSMKDEARHQHMMKEHPAKPPTSRKSSPLDAHASKGRSGHPTHMQAGNDNTGNPNAASADEYWRVHQQTSHHKKSPAKMVSPLNDTKVNNAPHKHKLEAPPRRRKQYEKSILKKWQSTLNLTLQLQEEQQVQNC
jgi:hypothetical protein